MTHIEALKKANDEIAGRQALMESAKMRQRYHFMPPAGWLNDPNGLIWYNNKYHFFYQHNPFDAAWGAMHWGHAISDDLLNWEHLPVALAPSEPYDLHERGGCFSGTAIEDGGKLYLMYTGAAYHKGTQVQTQCLAVSEDGINFEKYPGNPVITAPEGYDKSDFRDPKVWKHEDTFYLIAGAKKNDRAQALLYSSKNLTEWDFVNILHESRGDLGYMWECPDIFPIGGKYVLTFSPMGLGDRTAMYVVGDLDYDTGKFHPVSNGEIDWGTDFYAPQSFLDMNGRRIMVAWANGWAWMPWFKDFGPTQQEHWCGMFSLPREVRMCADNMLQFLPIEELRSLRCDEWAMTESIVSEETEIKMGDGVSGEILLKIHLTDSSANSFEIFVRQSKVKFDLQKSEMSVTWKDNATRSTFRKDGDILQVHIFADKNTIEVFTANYKTVHSCNVFADESKCYITPNGGNLVIKQLTAWGLKIPFRH